MNKKGQTLIELLLLISFSLIALSIIYLIYADYVASSNLSKEELMAKNTINKIINSANSLSFSGVGSTQKIFVEMPFDANTITSKIQGNSVVIVLSNNNSVFGSTIVEIEGDFKKDEGKLVKGGYFMTLTFVGDKVIVSYDEFEINNNSFFVPAKKNSLIKNSFTIRNTSHKKSFFEITSSFDLGNDIALSLSENEFELNPSELKTIDFNLQINDPFPKNYLGEILVTGINEEPINNEDSLTKTIIVSIEVMN